MGRKVDINKEHLYIAHSSEFNKKSQKVQQKVNNLHV